MAAKHLRRLLDDLAGLHEQYTKALEQNLETLQAYCNAKEEVQDAIKIRNALSWIPLKCRLKLAQFNGNWPQEMEIAENQVNERSQFAEACRSRLFPAEMEMQTKKRAWVLRSEATKDLITRLRANLADDAQGGTARTEAKAKPPTANAPLWDLFGRPTPAGVAFYFSRLDFAFVNIANLTDLPEPPAFTCMNRECETRKHERALAACACNIRTLFAGRNVKAERLRFHPDKFSSVAVEVREMIQRKAKEMFVTLDTMYRESLKR